MNYTEYIQNRKDFLHKNSQKDYVYIDADSNILISAPHGVVQTRLGRQKVAELGSIALALHLHKKTNTNFIAKTKNNFDDANFDESSPYKDEIKSHLSNLKYLIDFHGLASFRPYDVNLGINLGKNIAKNKQAFENLCTSLVQNGFIVSIDQPFAGGGKTIAGTFGDSIWTIQVEVNYHITNHPKSAKKLSLLVDIFTNWINTLKND